MVSRFQIEDLLTQDASGVVFRALDTETDRTVTVRRFFPFGVHGGGLSPEEQADYHIAVGRLAGIAHPALRSIICGACDPVDGMPFIATEWVEGTRLQSFVESGPLALEDAVHLLRQALEVCERISMVLGEEDVWVETDTNAIIVGDEASGRGATFWISPLRWLGIKDGQRGLEAIVGLAEDIMGWRDRTILDHEGGGLGGWVKRLRKADTKITLSEARELLAGVGGATPAAGVKRPVLQAIHGEPLKTAKRKSGLPMMIFGTMTLAMISLGGWALIQWNNARLNIVANAPVEEEPEEELVLAAPTEPPPIAEPQPIAKPQPVTKPQPVAAAPVKLTKPAAAATAPAPSQPKAADKSTPNVVDSVAPSKVTGPPKKDAPASQMPAPPNQVFKPEDSAKLLKMDGKEVTFEGVLKEFKQSNNKKDLYLVFSDNSPLSEARGSVAVNGAPADLSKEKLAPLKGKKIKLSGKVRIDNSRRTPVIAIQTRAAIQVITK